MFLFCHKRLSSICEGERRGRVRAAKIIENHDSWFSCYTRFKTKKPLVVSFHTEEAPSFSACSHFFHAIKFWSNFIFVISRQNCTLPWSVAISNSIQHNRGIVGYQCTRFFPHKIPKYIVQNCKTRTCEKSRFDWKINILIHVSKMNT